ncbi:MAG: YeeE/YedE family protein [Pseudomonadota bacterium]
MATLPAPTMAMPVVRWSAGAAFVLLVSLAIVTAATVGWRQAALVPVAAGLGVALYHAALGFTAYWRRWLVGREAYGVQVQLLIVAIGSLAFFPLIGGWLPGFQAGGAVAPLSLAVVVGAALFGIGMQLANGCGSGTLFTVGGGSTKMIIVLAAFVVGSVLGTLHLHQWHALPGLPAVSLVRDFGVPLGLLLQAALLLALFATVRRVARTTAAPENKPVPDRWWKGPWPAYAGGAVLALLAVAVFVIAHQPWGVTFGFTLWGAKLYEGMGGDLSGVPFWQADWARGALDDSVLRNPMSVTNFGVILGAMLAASLAGRFDPPWRVATGPAVAAVIGGLLMGYGARLAYGCNIGAFLGGTMSGSLHGWLWLAAALAGSWLGIRLRPRFGLANP